MIVLHLFYQSETGPAFFRVDWRVVVVVPVRVGVVHAVWACVDGLAFPVGVDAGVDEVLETLGGDPDAEVAGAELEECRSVSVSEQVSEQVTTT